MHLACRHKAESAVPVASTSKLCIRPVRAQTCSNNWDLPGSTSHLQVKQCAACGQTKQASHFYSTSANADGLSEKCRMCCRSKSAGAVR